MKDPISCAAEVNCIAIEALRRQLVGWMERSDAHHRYSADTTTMGIASLNPSFISWRLEWRRECQPNIIHLRKLKFK